MSIGRSIALSGKNSEKNFRDFIETKSGLLRLEKELKVKAKTAKAHVLAGRGKTDITVSLSNNNKTVDLNISLKKYKANFNQIERRSVSSFGELYNAPKDVIRLLDLFVGNIDPINYNGKKTKSNKRMFLNEFSIGDQNKIIYFFQRIIRSLIKNLLVGFDKKNKPSILALSTSETNFSACRLMTMDEAINKLIGDGKASITPRGSLKIGNITLQRKGGDNGAESANDLQWKFKPKDLANS